MLTSNHWNILRSLMNRIIPQDDFPDAWEAGVGNYLARQFDRDLHSQVETYHLGLEALEAESQAFAGKGFTEFFFDETGDTNKDTEAGADFGGFGAILKLTQTNPSANTGKLTLFYKSDVAHSGFDNVAFWTKDKVVFVEDAGDALHTQRNALDSAYLFDVTLDYSNPINQPIRILAEGRDPSATIDSGIGSIPKNGFQNDGDNEITGFHVSDGDPTPRGILGAKKPHALSDGWRVFYTQQHGDNYTWEIISAEQGQEERDQNE